MREVFDVLDYDTVVVLDSHWATTVEFVVTAQNRRAGLFTSEELPRGMCRRPYDFAGDPELAHAIAARGAEHGTWITAIDDDHLPIFYATTNLWEFLGDRGCPTSDGSRSGSARPRTPRTTSDWAGPWATRFVRQTDVCS